MLRPRQKLGKYRIVRRLSTGPLATVYQAFDTILGTRVALKIPVDGTGAEHDFVHEARVANRLVHPNILSIRDASYIDKHFVIVMALGLESLGDRLERRISQELAMSLATQALAAVAFAHERKVIHCDIKPENFILFPGNQLKLCDFGFAKISLRTIKASGSGTIDFIAPEQAMGRPKLQSDVFSLGLVLCRLLGGKLPEWPFNWPPPGIERLKKWSSAEQVAVLRRAIMVDPQKRYSSAVAMQRAFERGGTRNRSKSVRRTAATEQPKSSWRAVQWKEFRRRFSKSLALKFECRVCSGPVSEPMHSCPWCGVDNPTRGLGTEMQTQCPRCERGVKLDWHYCAWCFGRGFETETTRRYPDRRYSNRCESLSCHGPLMPFMKYCPWCKTKVRHKWKIAGTTKSCGRCGSGVAGDFWDFCAWCGTGLGRVRQSMRRNGSR